MKHNRKPRLCFVSSSGGHWEQLQKLKPLADKYEGFFVTEKTQFDAPLGKYCMIQTDLKDKMMPLKMIWNAIYLDQRTPRFRDYDRNDGCLSFLLDGSAFQ